MINKLCPFCRKDVSRNDPNSSVVGNTLIHDICVVKIRKWRQRLQGDQPVVDDPWEIDK